MKLENDINSEQMPRQGRLSVNTAWAMMGNIFYAGGRFLIFVILAKHFTSGQVGRVDFVLAVVTPISFLFNMELRSVFVTHTKDFLRAGHCLATRIISNGVFAIFLLGFLLVIQNRWEEEKCLLLVLAGMIRMAESWADVYLGVLQKHEQMKCWSISQIIKTSGVLIWAVVICWADKNIVWILGGWLVVTILGVWFYDRVQARKFESVHLRFDWKMSWWLVRNGFPLGIFVTLAILNQQVAKYFIASAQGLGDSAVAYFGVMMNFVFGAVAVQNGVNQAVLPRLARYFAHDKSEFIQLLKRVLGWSWLVMLVMLAVVWWRGDFILKVFYSEEYARQASLFTLVILAGCILLTGMILGDAIVACQKFKSRMTTVALGLLVNVILCWQFVGQYGLKGAVWAAVASSLVTTLSCAVVLIKSLLTEPHLEKAQNTK